MLSRMGSFPVESYFLAKSMCSEHFGIEGVQCESVFQIRIKIASYVSANRLRQKTLQPVDR